MEEILNQDEIDALFHAARDRTPEQAKPREENKYATPCNLRHARLISREQLRAVNMLHGIFARNLTRSLGAYLRVAEQNLISPQPPTPI